MTILRTPNFITLIYSRGIILIITLLHVILHKEDYLITIMLVPRRGILHKLRQVQMHPLQPISSEFFSVLPTWQLPSSVFVLISFIKKPLKGNADNATASKDGHIIYRQMIIGISVQFKERLKVKTIFM